MSKVQTTQSVSNVKNWEELRRYLSKTIGDIMATINGRISVADNCQMAVVDVSFVASDRTAVVNHGLNFIPTGYALAGANHPVRLYDGEGTPSTSQIFVKASGASFPVSAKVLVF